MEWAYSEELAGLVAALVAQMDPAAGKIGFEIVEGILDREEGTSLAEVIHMALDIRREGTLEVDRRSVDSAA